MGMFPRFHFCGIRLRPRVSKLVVVAMVRADWVVERCGVVVSGRGNATPLLRGRKELSAYFGAEPHPGSLNILLDWPIQFRPARVKIRLEDYLVAWAGTMDGRPCLVQRWPNCPLHVLEVISPYRFGLEKGERARVQFYGLDLAPLPWSKLLGWSALWALRRRYAYSNDSYYEWAQEIAGRWPAWFGQQPFERDGRLQ